MRLAIVSAPTSWPPRASGGGGPDRRVVDLATALAGAGQDVRVYLPGDTDPKGPIPDGVSVTPLPGAGATTRADEAAESWGVALADAWDGWQPDLVHAHRWLAGLAAVAATQRMPAPVALTYHEVSPPATGGRANGDPQRPAMEQRLAHTVDRVITQSRAETDALVQLGVSRQHMTLVPAGVDAGKFTPDGPRAPRRAPSRMLVVGAANRLDDRKGIGDAIRALARVPGAELVVIGGSGESDLAGDEQVNQLRALAGHCGVADRVRFVGGVHREQMPDWYRSADLVVCPSWYEPIGMTALEAMACGVPVVATAVGGHRDSVVEGLTGALVPARDPAALAHAARRMLGDPIRRMAFAAAARDRARQCYAWERVTRCLDGTYRQLCPQPEVIRTASA